MPTKKTESNDTKNEGISSPPPSGGKARTRAFGTKSLMGGLSTGRVAELRNKMVEMVDERRKENPEHPLHNVGFLILNDGNYYPVILVTYKQDDSVFYHALVAPDPNFTMPPEIQRPTGYGTVRVMVTPGDAYDQLLDEMATQAIATQMGVDINKIYSVDGSIIPPETDLDHPEIIKGLLASAIDALWAEVNVITDNHPSFVIPEFVRSKGSNGYFQVQMTVNTGQSDFVDAAGQPVHQQISLVLRYRVPNGGSHRGSMHDKNSDFDIGRVSGYIDFDVTDRRPNPMTGMPGPMFVPNFIITEVVSADNECATTDFVLSLILSSIALNRDMFWLSAFRETIRDKGDLVCDDIGYLNLEAGIGAKQGQTPKIPDFKKASGVQDLIQFASQVIVPETFNISIDVPQASPSTWYLSIFRAAAGINGSDIQNQALRRIGNAAHSLTDGIFNTNETASGIMLPMYHMVHGGYYMVNREKRDLRSIMNYLSVAKWAQTTGQGLPMITQYTETLYSGSTPADIRASQRKALILDQMNIKPTYLQYIHRVTFNNEFLGRLAAAAVNAGFSPIPDSNVSGEDFARRSYASAQNAVHLGGFIGQQTMGGGWNTAGFGRTFL